MKESHKDNPGVIAFPPFIYLAFLLMDLDHRALRPFANLVFNRYA